MPTTPALPLLSSRHPAVIGALEALRVILTLSVTVLGVALVAWFVSIAQLQPLRAVVSWAGTLLAASAGWELEGGWGLPPTLLTLGLLVVLVSGLGRTRRALAANEVLVRSGALPAVRGAMVLGMATCLVLCVVYLVLAGLLAGAGGVTLLGLTRFVLLLLVVVALSVLGPDRRGGTASRWTLALLDLVADRVGGDWADALETTVPVLRRALRAAVILAALACAVALVVGRSAIAEALAGYSDPTAAAVGVTAVQLLFAPTVLLFALSWMSGAGIQLSTAVLATPFAEQGGIVPAVPVLAVIPTGSPVWGWALLLALPLATGIAAVGRRAWADQLEWRTVVLAAAGCFAASAAASLFATGAVGPSGLEAFGVPVLPAIGLIGAGAAAGIAGGWGLSLLASRAAADR